MITLPAGWQRRRIREAMPTRPSRGTPARSGVARSRATRARPGDDVAPALLVPARLRPGRGVRTVPCVPLIFAVRMRRLLFAVAGYETLRLICAPCRP